MPEASAPRRHARDPIQLPFLYRVKGAAPVRAGVGWTRDLSEGGAAVELPDRLAPQTLLRLLLQTGRGSFELEAEVVWSAEPDLAGGGISHGLAFPRLSPEQLHAVRELLLPSDRPIRHAGVRLPAEVAVRWKPKGQPGLPLPGTTGNVSRGGLLLQLPQAITPGTLLEVTLEFATEPVSAEGTIVWVEPPEHRRAGEPIRHGLRFTGLDWRGLLALALFLASVP
jgi:PilZ domain